MNTSLIEIFIEANCRACSEVLGVIETLVTGESFRVRVYKRDKDKEVFRDRSVVICPATFVNNRLAFYGAFSRDEFSKYLRSHQ